MSEKVTCLVTDVTANMIGCVRKFLIRHTICIAHSLNSTVLKSCYQIETLTDIRNKTRQIVAYIRTSTTAKEELAERKEEREEVQLQTRGPVKKLMNEVSTRWNSMYLMLERMVEQKESVLVSLAPLKSDIPQLTTDDNKMIENTFRVLALFNQAVGSGGSGKCNSNA